MDEAALADPAYLAAVSDVLGVLAYGELQAFIRLGGDSELAPTPEVAERLARVARSEYDRYVVLADYLDGLGIDVQEAMGPFVGPLTQYHARTKAKTWLEGLVKAYIGDGVAGDFYREVAQFLDPQTAEVIKSALADNDETTFLVDTIREGLERDPDSADKVALWARRLLGEALAQAQATVGAREGLADLLVGERADLTEVAAAFNRVSEAHVARMKRLGLNP